MPHELRIVVVSTLGPVDRFILAAVAARHPLAAIIQPVWERPPGARTRLQNLLRRPLSMPLRWVEQRYLAKRAARRWARIEKALEATGVQTLPSVSHTVPTWTLNEKRGVELLQSLRPDILLVSSGPILSSEVVTIARLGALNLHYGLAPWYRGEHTLYAPLRCGDVEHIGVTLHEIDSGIDTGRLVARTALDVDEDDTEASLWIKAAKEFAEMVPAALDSIAQTGRVIGVPQESVVGRMIRYRDRRWWWDVVDRLSLPKPRPTSRSRDWYFMDTPIR